MAHDFGYPELAKKARATKYVLFPTTTIAAF